MSFSCSSQQSCSTKSFSHTVLILTASGFKVQFSTWLLQESQWQSHDPAQLQLPVLVAHPGTWLPGSITVYIHLDVSLCKPVADFPFFPCFHVAAGISAMPPVSEIMHHHTRWASATSHFLLLFISCCPTTGCSIRLTLVVQPGLLTQGRKKKRNC